jgi:hypothetical protein
VPLAIAWISVCKVETAKRITDVVRSSEDLTSITGITPDSALVVLALASSVIVNIFAATTLSKALVIKASVSISTLAVVSVYSFSISSVIALN